MEENAPYIECKSPPFGEDINCSNSLNFKLLRFPKYAFDHRHYFNRKVSLYL